MRFLAANNRNLQNAVIHFSRKQLITIDLINCHNVDSTLLYDSFESRISQGLKESTVASYRTKITSFLLDLQNLGCDRLSAVTETAVLSCILKSEERKRNANVCSRLAYFFRFLSESGNSEASRILHYIPPMRFARKNIDYLTDEEIHKSSLTPAGPGLCADLCGSHHGTDVSGLNPTNVTGIVSAYKELASGTDVTQLEAQRVTAYVFYPGGQQGRPPG